MNTLPFEFEGWDDIDSLTFNHYNAKFTKDFGVFSKDETHSCVTVDFAKGWMEAYDADGKVVKRQTFGLSPTEQA